MNEHQTLQFRCPWCGEYADFTVHRASLDQPLIETTTFGQGPANPSYVPGPLTADVEAISFHSCRTEVNP